METIKNLPSSMYTALGDMDTISKVSIWYNRAILLFVSFLFTMIGFKSMFSPIENAALTQITLGSAKAISVARVSMGAFPFSFAVIVFTSIFSVKQIYRGIYSVFILIVIVTAVRLIGYTVDGVAPFIVPEIAVTILSGIGLYLEIKRRKKYSAN